MSRFVTVGRTAACTCLHPGGRVRWRADHQRAFVVEVIRRLDLTTARQCTAGEHSEAHRSGAAGPAGLATPTTCLNHQIEGRSTYDSVKRFRYASPPTPLTDTLATFAARHQELKRCSCGTIAGAQ